MSTVRDMLERELGLPVRRWDLRVTGGVAEPVRRTLTVELFLLMATEKA